VAEMSQLSSYQAKRPGIQAELPYHIIPKGGGEGGGDIIF
jgi:hypothetical protein